MSESFGGLFIMWLAMAVMLLGTRVQVRRLQERIEALEKRP